MSSQQTGLFERKIHKTELEVHTTAHTIHQKMSFQQDVNLSALEAGGGGGCSELSREGEETLKRLQITVRMIW